VTLGRFLAGIPLSLFALVPLALAARAWCRRLFPEWNGVEARLVEVVFVLTAMTVVAEALGTIGWFKPAPVVVGFAIAGLIGYVTGRRVSSRRGPEATGVVDGSAVSVATRDTRSLMPVAIAIGGIALVGGAWLARTVGAIDHGMNTVDTFWYHLPAAARFVQTGRTTTIQYFDSEPVTAFFPMTSSLLHGIGFLMFRTDLFSTVINLAWLSLALAAAWSVGRRFGVAPAATLGTLLLLGTPGMVGTQPGGAYDDIAGLALLLTALAVALAGPGEERSIPQDVVAALAVGLALGIKFTFVLPAAAVCVGLALTAPRGSRVRRAAAMFAAATVAGGYWYVRNAVATGNPLPSLSVHLGPLSLPSVKGATPTSTVAKFVFDGTAWRENFLPGLRSSFGPAWIAVVAFAFAGLVIAVVQRSEPQLRMLGAVGLACAAGYLFTPQYLTAGFGTPFYFGVNLRYASPAIVIGLILFSIVLRRWGSWVLGALALAVVATQLDPTSWPTGVPWAPFAGRVSTHDALWATGLLIVASALVVTSIRIWKRFPEELVRMSVVLAMPVLVLLALAGVHGRYLEHRYSHAAPFPAVYAWPRHIRDARIAVAGPFMQGQYPILGPDLSNFVQFAGVRTKHGGYESFTSCSQWVKFLESGRYGYVVIAVAPDLEEWTAAQADAHVVVTQLLGRGGKASVKIFRLDANNKSRSC
jgi:hypothetical protein